MNDISSLSGRELDVEIAKAIGGRDCPEGCEVMGGPHEHSERGLLRSRGFVDYSTSLDALAEVEGRLREADWMLTVQILPEEAFVPFQAAWEDRYDHRCEGNSAVSEARARARAALAALRVLHNGEGE